MKALLYILQTSGLSFILIVLLKAVSSLRNLWLRTAVKIRKKYNKKHGLPQNNGISEIDSNSLSYQIDNVEGGVVAIILLLAGLLLTLFVPVQKDSLFSIFAVGLAISAFLYCWFIRHYRTNKYRIFVYVSCCVSSLLTMHAVLSFSLNSIILVPYSNSINAILYIWSTMLFYTLLLGEI